MRYVIKFDKVIIFHFVPNFKEHKDHHSHPMQKADY